MKDAAGSQRFQHESVAQLCYFVLGTGLLTGWNAFLTASDYFNTVFPGRSIDRVFTVTYLPITLCLIGVVSRWPRLMWTGPTRILVGYCLFTLCCAAVPLIDVGLVQQGSTTAAYALVLLCVVLVAVGDGLTQPTVFADAALLPDKYTQCVVMGAAASGVSIGALRLITKGSLPQTLDGLRVSTQAYFAASAAITAAALLLYQLLLPRLDVVQHYRSKLYAAAGFDVAAAAAAAAPGSRCGSPLSRDSHLSIKVTTPRCQEQGVLAVQRRLSGCTASPTTAQPPDTTTTTTCVAPAGPLNSTGDCDRLSGDVQAGTPGSGTAAHTPGSGTAAHRQQASACAAGTAAIGDITSAHCSGAAVAAATAAASEALAAGDDAAAVPPCGSARPAGKQLRQQQEQQQQQGGLLPGGSGSTSPDPQQHQDQQLCSTQPPALQQQQQLQDQQQEVGRQQAHCQQQQQHLADHQQQQAGQQRGHRQQQQQQQCVAWKWWMQPRQRYQKERPREVQRQQQQQQQWGQQLGGKASDGNGDVQGAAAQPCVVGQLSCWNIVQLNWRLCVAGFMTYCVTLSIFPGFLAENVHSVALRDWYPVLLIFTYNIFDFLGRCIPEFTWRPHHVTILGMSLSRLALIPLYAGLAVYGASEAAFFVLTSALGLSNGWLTTLIFCGAPRGLNPSAAELAGMINVFAELAGLNAGAFLGWLWTVQVAKT